MKIKGAIFDMDGTIVDSLMYWSDFWNRLGEKYMNRKGFQASEEVDKKVRTMIFADAMAYIKEYCNISEPIEELLRFSSNGLLDFYREVARPKTGAIALLEYLKAQNVKLCLASATAMKQVKYALECHDMAKYFDVVLSCADIGVGKDQPDIYLLAQKKLGLPTEDLCVFEDSYVALETAKKVGYQTVGIYDQYNFEQKRLENASDIYLPKGKTLDTLIDLIRQSE